MKFKKILTALLLTALVMQPWAHTAFAADQRIAYTEEMVGSGHPTKSDTLNRLATVEHSNDGTHQKAISHLTASKPVFTDGSKLLTSSGTLGVDQGGTGATTLADGGLVIGNGTGAVEVVAPGATTDLLVGGGAATAPVWTTATGTGAPVRANSPTLVTPALDTPSSVILTNATGLPWSTGVSSKPTLQNLLTNSGFGVWSNGTLENVGSDLVTNGADWTGASGTTPPTGWTVRTYSGGGGTNSFANTDGYLTMGNDSCGKSLEQGITTVIGKIYRFSVSHKNGTGIGKITIYSAADFGGTELAKNSALNDADWATTTLTFKAITTTTYVHLINNNSYTTLFDSVTLYEVTPGCVAADTLGADGMSKTSTLDIHREYGSAYISGLYGVKATKGADTAEYLNLSSRSDEAWYKQFRGRTVGIGCYIYSTTATDNVKLQINDSDGTTESSFVGANALTWVEVTRTCGASITSFTPRVLFDGDTSDVAYVSKPMLIFGSSIGSGNYAPIPNEQILTEANITLTDYTATTSAADGIIYLEAQSSGKVPKGAKAVLVKAYGKDSAAGDGVGFDVQSASGVEDGISIDTQVNNIRVQGQGWVKCDSNGDIYFDHRGSGAAALTADIKVIGIMP